VTETARPNRQDRIGQTETVQTETAQTETTQTESARPNRPDRIAQTEKSCSDCSRVVLVVQTISIAVDAIAQGFLTFLWPCTLQHFNRWARTPKIIDIFKNKPAMIFESNIHRYVYKCLEINI